MLFQQPAEVRPWVRRRGDIPQRRATAVPLRSGVCISDAAGAKLQLAAEIHHRIRVAGSGRGGKSCVSGMWIGSGRIRGCARRKQYAPPPQAVSSVIDSSRAFRVPLRCADGIHADDARAKLQVVREERLRRWHAKTSRLQQRRSGYCNRAVVRRLVRLRQYMQARRSMHSTQPARLAGILARPFTPWRESQAATCLRISARLARGDVERPADSALGMRDRVQRPPRCERITCEFNPHRRTRRVLCRVGGRDTTALLSCRRSLLS